MEQRKENKLGTMPVGKLLASVSLPLMVSMLVQAMYNIVDGIYVSQISENALTATSLAFPAQMLMISVAVGTGVGINSLLARRLGEKRFDEANATATNGLFLALCSYLVFMLLGMTLSRPFISAFTDDAELIELGTSYLSICLIYSAGIFLGVTFERLLQATGNSFLSMLAQLAGAITNIILDPILIFGRFGMPQMGIKGAAIATVIGQMVGFLVGMILNLIKNKEIHFKFKGFRPNPEIIGFIYKVGVPSIIMQSIGSVMLVGMNKILIVFSTTAVAVFGVYFKLQSFVFMPVFGLTQGLIPIVGYNYGAKKPDRLMKSYKLGTIIAVVIMLFGTLVFQLIPDQLLLMFDASEDMLAIGSHALRIISLTFVPAAISIVIGNTLAGMGNGIVSMINSFMRQMIILLPCAYFLAKYFGLDFAWYSMCISEVASLIFSSICFVKAYKKHILPLEQLQENQNEITEE